MARLKRLSIPVLLGMLLIAALAGVVSARPNARPSQQAWRVLTLPAHACIPEKRTTDYEFAANHVKCVTTGCAFACPIDFPAAGEQALGAVNVRRVTMYAYDNAGRSVGFWLHKVYPPSGAKLTMAAAIGAASAADPQTVMDTSVVGNPVYRTQALYLGLGVAISDCKVYGLFIHYTWL